MQWVTIQLTPWALKTKRLKELKRSLNRYKTYQGLQIKYPAHEDQYDKNDTGFGEYIFLEYRDNIDYSSLNGTEDFDCVLRSSEDTPHLMSDQQVDAIMESAKVRYKLQPGDSVRVKSGGMRGNVGVVQHVDEDQVHVSVTLGNDVHEITLPLAWLKPIHTNKENKNSHGKYT